MFVMDLYSYTEYLEVMSVSQPLRLSIFATQITQMGGKIRAMCITVEKLSVDTHHSVLVVAPLAQWLPGA